MRDDNFQSLRQFVSEKSRGPDEGCLAARKLLERFNAYREELSRIDVEHLAAQWENLIAGRDIETLTEKEIEVGCKLEEDIRRFNELRTIKEETSYSLQALSFLIKRLDGKQVLNEINPQSWISKHEVLTRWAWMETQ